MKLYRLSLLAFAFMALAGCSSLQTVINTAKTVADAQIPANIALVAANGFDAGELTAANILVTCTPTPTHVVPAVCVTQKASIKTMNASILAGRPIRNAIEPTTPGVAQPVSKSAYDRLQAITATLTAAVSTFNTAKAGA